MYRSLLPTGLAFFFTLLFLGCGGKPQSATPPKELLPEPPPPVTGTPGPAVKNPQGVKAVDPAASAQ